MLRSGNPVLRADSFSKVRAQDSSAVMTIEGTVNKTLVLLLLTVLGAGLVWGNPRGFLPFTALFAILGFVVAIITVFKRKWAYITAPIYAGVEGLVVGTLSALFEQSYPGIVLQAVSLTFGTLFCLLMAYKSRLIKVTENFKLGVIAATGGIALVYFVNIIMGFFGASIPFIHSNGIIGIGFSLFVVVIASLNLVMDFDFIEKGSKQGAAKYMEWYAAFGLIVTLIWLYLEMLRLLAKISSRR